MTEEMSADALPWTAGRSAEDAALIVAALEFLEASTAGDWVVASRYVTADARYVFPSGAYDSLADVSRASRGRYRWLRKSFAWVDLDPRPATAVVGIGGTLAGANAFGITFDGIRFFDRLVLDRRQGRVVEQQVFNDLAVSRVLERRA